MIGKVVFFNISEKKGVRKKPVKEVSLKTEYGIEGDCPSSSAWHRQVSLLAVESIQKTRDKGLDVKPGDFEENITAEGIDLLSHPYGTQLTIGNKCHTGRDLLSGRRLRDAEGRDIHQGIKRWFR